MEHYIIKILIIIFLFMVITRIYMVVASYIGEQLGIGKFLINLYQKIRRNK